MTNNDKAMQVNLLDKWEADLKSAKAEFEFTSKHDMRLATPDYAKYKAAYTAFSVAERIIEAAKATNMFITMPEVTHAE